MTFSKGLLVTISFIAASVLYISCSAGAEEIPPAPQSITAVQDFVKHKKFVSTKAGMYGSLTVNGKTDINWIDTADKKDEIVSGAAAKEIGVSYNFLNDTAVMIRKNGDEIPGTYEINDATDPFFKEDPGIKIRVTYPDKEFGNTGMPSNVTYVFNVLGAGGDKLLLQTARTINGSKVLALYDQEKK